MIEPRVIRWRETEDAVLWTPPEPLVGEIIFPEYIVALEALGAGIRVKFGDGTESRAMLHPRRGYVIPRRWRKPRPSSSE